MIPDPWEGVVLALAAWRVWRFLSRDTFPPLTPMHEWIENGRRPWLAEMWNCPYCLGTYVALITYGCWLLNATWTLYVAAALALCAAVGLIASLDRD